MFKNRGNIKIIASYHDIDGSTIWDYDCFCQTASNFTRESPHLLLMSDIYNRLAGYGDIVKLISKANSEQDNFALENFRASIYRLSGINKPLIALNMGKLGQTSRAQNLFMTPVTHKTLNTIAAPGQLTLPEINTLRHLSGHLDQERFFLVGYPIKASKSPLLHNSVPLMLKLFM